MLKNSIVEFNKTTSIDSFHTTEIDGELIFQQLFLLEFGLEKIEAFTSNSLDSKF
ncbi:PF07601 family protein [Leptospira interrogans str. HAI1594]|uniref:Uncharacterized protein n=1 Tax=Leptospira interrogans serovar Hardjo str. Norma TaxID=1279460 RepID=A0A0M4N6R3_LEPIR|nr:hypothetical protein G436_2917 [Leptospira interrogans serovar Hardjo str. Norma]EKP77750.1 PF07601 family protein [Leptospira interrogans str. HAI1594]